MKTRRRSCGRSELLSIYRLITVCVLELVRDVMRKRHFTDFVKYLKEITEFVGIVRKFSDSVSVVKHSGYFGI